MRYRDLITLAIVSISQITGNNAVHFLCQAYEMPAGCKNGGEGIGEVGKGKKNGVWGKYGRRDDAEIKIP